MGTYIPALVWVISGIICHFIARKRSVRATVPRQLMVDFPRRKHSQLGAPE